MTNFEAALQIIQNSKGISEAQLMANKAAYIANRIAVNRLWLIIAAAVLTALIVLCVISAHSEGTLNVEFDAVLFVTFFVGTIAAIVIVCTAVALNGWLSDPTKKYANYILQMASDCVYQGG